jgi:hypothetical protein
VSKKSVSNEDLLKEIIELKKQLEGKTIKEYVPYPVYPQYPFPYTYPWYPYWTSGTISTGTTPYVGDSYTVSSGTNWIYTS